MACMPREQAAGKQPSLPSQPVPVWKPGTYAPAYAPERELACGQASVHTRRVQTYTNTRTSIYPRWDTGVQGPCHTSPFLSTDPLSHTFTQIVFPGFPTRASWIRGHGSGVVVNTCTQTWTCLLPHRPCDREPSATGGPFAHSSATGISYRHII